MRSTFTRFRSVLSAIVATIAIALSFAEAMAQTVPVSNNLYRFAYRVKYEDCRLAVGPGDSFSSLEEAARLTSAIPYTWHPDKWKGFFLPSGVNGTASAVGTSGTSFQLIGGGLPMIANRTAGTITRSGGTLAITTNRFSSSQLTASYIAEGSNNDGEVHSISTVDSDYKLSIPAPWREWYIATGATAADANQLLFAFYSNYRVNGLWWDRGTDVDWTCGGDSIYARAVFYGNSTLSPASINIRGFRNSGSPSYAAAAVSVATNVNGYLYGVTECGAKSAPSAAATDFGLFIQNPTSVEVRGTTTAVVGALFYRPTISTGLTVVPLAGGGSRLDDWLNTAKVTDLGAQTFLSYAVGETPNTTGPKNGPNAYFIMLGTNVTSAESTELSAGTYTNYKASLKLLVARIRTWSAALGVQDPLICLATPYLSTQTATFMTALSSAMYEVSREDGSVSFINTYRLMPHARNNAADAYANYTSWHTGGVNGTGNDARWLAGTSEVHTTMNGSMAVMSNIWNQFEAAIDARSEYTRLRNRYRPR